MRKIEGEIKRPGVVEREGKKKSQRGREGNSTRVVSTSTELQSARLWHLYLDLCTRTRICTRVNGTRLFDNHRFRVPS